MDANLLDPPFTTKGTMSILCEVQCFDSTQKVHVLRTALRGRMFRLEGTLPAGATALLLVGVKVKEMQTDRPLLTVTPDTKVFQKPFLVQQDLVKVVELCSGIGCLGFGLEHAGFQVVQRCDSNARMLELASQIHSAPTTVGDVCNDSLLTVLGETSFGSIAAGVACQPYSRLGDRRQECDPRSLTLPGVLRLGFLNRCGIIIIECVDAAGTCPWVQGVLKAFTALTGYHIAQETLHLHQTWPARRSRWWCILTHPCIGKVPWEPMPTCSPLPLVANLIDQFLPCSAPELAMLELDLYELRRFDAVGFEKNEVKWAGQMATSLHSCANQFMACPCGCRAYAFTDQRLSQGGLDSLLIRLEGCAQCGNNVYWRHRYIHPDELALLNGMIPGLPWGSNFRLALCALGQLASPIQSTWVGSLVLRQLATRDLFGHQVDPHKNLSEWMAKLLRHRDQVFGPPGKPQTQSFQHMVDRKEFVQTPIMRAIPKPSAKPGLANGENAAEEPGSLSVNPSWPAEKHCSESKVTNNPAQLADAGFADHEPPTPGIGATPGDHTALDEAVINPPNHEPPNTETMAKPSLTTGPEAAKLTCFHAGPGDIQSRTPGMWATPGDSNAHPEPTRSTPKPDAAGAILSCFHAGPGDNQSRTPGIGATPGDNNAHPKHDQGGIFQALDHINFDDDARRMPPPAESLDGHLAPTDATKGCPPQIAGPDDTKSLTPGIRATPGHQNALGFANGLDAAGHIGMPTKVHEHPQQPKRSHADSTALGSIIPGIRATPGDNNALTNTAQAIEGVPFADAATPSRTPQMPGETNSKHVTDSAYTEQPPELPCAEWKGCPSLIAKGTNDAESPSLSIPHQDATSNAFAEKRETHEHTKRHGSSIDAHPAESTVNHKMPPGIEATPGHQNASTMFPGGPITELVECPANGGVIGFAAHPQKKRRCAPPGHGEGINVAPSILTKGQTEAVPIPTEALEFPDSQCHHVPQHPLNKWNANKDKALAEKSEQCPEHDTHSQGSTMLVPHVTGPSHEKHPEAKLISILIMHAFEGFPHVCQVPVGTTAVQVLQAESNLHGLPFVPVTLMNTHVPLGVPLHDQQVLVLLEDPMTYQSCPFTDPASQPPSIAMPNTRLQALWKQQAWVALDEMEFFLEATMVDDAAIPFPPASFHDGEEVKERGESWLQPAFDSCGHSGCMPWCSAAIVANHWIPVIVVQQGNTIHFHTTPEGSCFVQVAEALTQQQGKTSEVKQTLLPQAFPADCGFQSLAWLIAILQDNPVEPLPPNKAAQWRTLFARELLTHQTGHQIVTHLVLGGHLESHEMQQLVSLLNSHGVWPDRANERANQIVSKISFQTVRSILKSPRPWQDLKAAANNLSPPLKLIMTDELNKQIETRVQQRKYGKKPTARGRRIDGPKDNPVLTAAEVQVPHGVFRQQDGTVLGPLHINEVGPTAKGILVLDQEDCQATLRLPKPVSPHGLAVIVLATAENATAHPMDSIRFPALCLSTQEPLIASGYMYQLGSQTVTRHEPQTKLAIEERETETVRCLVYKDQAGSFWEDIQSHPVKHIFQAEPLLNSVSGSQSPVIDVWDRQWVSKKYEKVRPANAEVFLFSFRMNAEPLEELVAKSGQNGIFWEPRSSCGRYPNANYHVTWLQSMTFQDAKYAQQTSPQATSLARHGDRFGLRCDTMNAQEIHDKHRPNTPMLLGHTKTTYMIGPLPYSTTREALIKLLKAWEWDAKPLQPRGRSQDGQGVNWSILATEDPGHWVYTLQHGDVLVSKVQPEKQNISPPQYSIVASKKTIEHLQATAIDPWINYDPWKQETQKPKPGNAKVPTSTSQSAGLTPAQLATLETNLTKSLAQNLKKGSEEDINMEQSAMENRIAQLEHQFNHMQQAQASTDTKVSQLQTQIDQQSRSLGDKIDQKMTEQMDRIEQLLCKRIRHE